MASLGELTAGIAHEIQNPINFVNNFSEVSNELIDEMKEKIIEGNYAEASTIADDVKKNLDKINHHGKRADSIVKGMLQHSRSSAGSKEPTDLAALADEYLRLAYHGMRAKDKSFNTSIKTDFDPQLPLVPVVAQDISRVLLNLFNNAFYAVHEKSKTAGPSYEPTVTVRASLEPSAVGHPPSAIISIADNGPGIPESIKEKIFQPFFTTKPTGQGTGLGLSLSYDIIKAHGGELSLAQTQDTGTSFVIRLPLAP
jgi:signal transduction histidine kinase